MNNPFLIGIAGESGVGKSTIADVISFFFDYDNVLTISTDDLHRWERNDKNWKMFTHLNPIANNIEMGDSHLLDLKNNKTIYRSIYNHKTGCFDPPKKLIPKKVIIIEGLHAFYSDVSKQNIDLKIFIDTDEDLKNHWKIIRDTHERGYTFTDVLKVVKKRKNDAKIIRDKQIYDADVIVTIKPKNKIGIIGNENEKIEIQLEIENKKNVYPELFNFIKNFNLIFKEYIDVCKILGSDVSLIQDKGGNFSIKINDDLMIIKSSGVKIKNTAYNYGFSIIEYSKIKKNLLDHSNKITENFLSNIYSKNFNKPSMETGFHILLDKVVIHTHPIYLNVLLCLQDSELLIKNLFFDLKYTYIKYKNPGSKLINEIARTKDIHNIIFLENHGLIVTADNVQQAVELTKEINLRSKKYIKDTLKQIYFSFEEFIETVQDNIPCKNYSLPDTAVFLTEILNNSELHNVQKYIDIFGSKLGNLRYLTNDDIVCLNSLEAEKYRKKL